MRANIWEFLKNYGCMYACVLHDCDICTRKKIMDVCMHVWCTIVIFVYEIEQWADAQDFNLHVRVHRALLWASAFRSRNPVCVYVCMCT